MFYNTGELDDPAEVNSIFEPDNARKYLDGAPERYPLPLDVALPVFSWAVVFREGEFFRLLPGFTDDRLGDTTRFRRTAAHRAVVLQNTFQQGIFLRPGDALRVEGLTPGSLDQAAELAAKSSLTGSFHVAFFDLDSATVRRFAKGELEGTLGRFSRE